MESLELFESESTLSLDDLGCGDIRGPFCYYVFSRSTRDKGVIPFVLRSDGKLVHVTETTMDESTLSSGEVVRNLCVPQFRSWSDASIRDFIHKDYEVTPFPELYQKVKAVLRKSIFLDEVNLSILATAAIGSYFINLAKAAPMISLRGNHGSGKSHCASVVLRLGFNGSQGESVAAFGKASQSSIFRSIASSRNIMAFDDIEVINSSKSTPLRVGMLVSYKRATAIQTLTERGKPKNYNLFQIKLLSSINEAEPILRSRTIEVNLHRAPVGFLPADIDEEIFQALRDELHTAAMDDGSRKLMENFVRKASVDVSFVGRFGEITAILRGVAEACNATNELAHFFATGEAIPSTKPDVSAVITKILSQGFKAVTVAQIQSELLLVGQWISSNRLGVEINKSGLLKNTTQVAVHGLRSMEYTPTRKAKKMAVAPLKQESRAWCLQGYRKQFNAERCLGCPYTNVCPIRKLRLGMAQKEV